jgi:RNA-directed DNA polymerase
VTKRWTEGRRLTRRLNEIRAELWRRMHAPVAIQQARLVSVLRGDYAYYGLPSNWHRLDSFYDAVRGVGTAFSDAEASGV